MMTEQSCLVGERKVNQIHFNIKSRPIKEHLKSSHLADKNCQNSLNKLKISHRQLNYSNKFSINMI